jgi:uncharacterized RDD family membrane protein YckC
VGAFIIDAIISWAVTAGAFFATTKTSDTLCGFTPKSEAWQGVGLELSGGCRFWGSGGAFGAYLALALAVPIVLFWVLPALTGYTPGKAIVGVRIIRRNGNAPGFGRVFVRQLMWIVDYFPYIIPALTGFLVANSDKQSHQRLGDRVAGTFVIDKNAFGSFIPDQHQGQLQQQGGYGQQQQPFNAGQQQQQPAAVGGGSGGPAPGWYEDPQREARLRYWDGTSWTSNTSG